MGHTTIGPTGFTVVILFMARAVDLLPKGTGFDPHFLSLPLRHLLASCPGPYRLLNDMYLNSLWVDMDKTFTGTL